MAIGAESDTAFAFLNEMKLRLAVHLTFSRISRFTQLRVLGYPWSLMALLVQGVYIATT